MRVLKFYMNLKVHLKGLNPLTKFLAFKLIVGVTFLLSVSRS